MWTLVFSHVSSVPMNGLLTGPTGPEFQQGHFEFIGQMQIYQKLSKNINKKIQKRQMTGL